MSKCDDKQDEFLKNEYVINLDELTMTRNYVYKEQTFKKHKKTDLSVKKTNTYITNIYEEDGTYYVALIAENESCRDTAMVNLVINPYFALYIPNVFTPNQDGLNDNFEPKGVGIEEYEIFIFNRWGEQVFTSDDILNSWDGGEAVSGMYTYIINVVDKIGEFHRKTGFVLIE